MSHVRSFMSPGLRAGAAGGHQGALPAQRWRRPRGTFGDLPVVAEAPAKGDGDGRQISQAVRRALHAAVDARAAHGLRGLVGGAGSVVAGGFREPRRVSAGRRGVGGAVRRVSQAWGAGRGGGCLTQMSGDPGSQRDKWCHPSRPSLRRMAGTRAT